MAEWVGAIKPLLMIDAGHGGVDSGAGGNGIVEKAMTLQISLYQYERFQELGIAVALTRNIDKTLEPNDRTAMIKKSGAKYCMSNHINAASSTSANGAEFIHSVHSNGKWSSIMAQCLANAGQVLRPRATYSKAQSNGQDYYFMHRLTGNVETVIVEYGFLSNSTDADRLKSNWKSYAEAMVKAFCEYTNHPYQPESVKPIIVAGFTDIGDHWAKDSIVKAVNSGLMNGVSQDKFAPDEPITRAQIAVILDRAGLS
ncbi:N-acetylmuramoyl-L-alanine amidase [Paenibacillus yanchengensis]|uniref:N-acetylmuramoyl-L-alanine amidase n=1 Tax=Paenibacillus yanchengensis TaxID=2035833 RepID=A0ABW4YNA1_9BACL